MFWENFFTQLAMFGVLAIIIELALFQIFQTKLWKKIETGLDEHFNGDFFDLKPWLSAAICLVLVFQMQLDMIALMFEKGSSFITVVVTGLFLAGGSTRVYMFLKKSRELKDNIQGGK